MLKSAAAVSLNRLAFTYEGAPHPLFRELTLEVPRQSRTLLIGANGVGKSTLLRLIAGHHLLSRESLQVLGSSPFYDLALSQDVRLIGADFPLNIDMTVREVLAHGPVAADSNRQAELTELLGIDPAWRMNRVSEGQKRRVQLLLALRKPAKLLLLDEVTAHLDVVIRSDLLNWLNQETLRSDLTLIYATHILDGLWTHPSDPWPTHLAFLSFDGLRFFGEIAQIPELQASQSASPLFSLCESWIREDLAKDPTHRRKF